MWLSGEGAWERSLSILVFLSAALPCSFLLRSLLKPMAQHTSLVKLACFAILYSFIMGTLTTQLGVMLLNILPEMFGGQPEFNVNAFIIITICWSLIFALWSLIYLFALRQRDLTLSKANETRLDTLLTSARLNTLQGQINPHFMFNAINNIRALVLEDKNRSREMLANLSDILRYSLESEQESTILIDKEIEIVEEYLALCKIQYEQRLNSQINIAKNCQHLYIPRMLIQMLTENAIKHGIAECLQTGDLHIDVYRENSLLIVQVSNSGQLRNNPISTSSGIGIKNITQRLKLIYGEQASFTIKQAKEQVFAKATIALALTENAPKGFTRCEETE